MASAGQGLKRRRTFVTGKLKRVKQDDDKALFAPDISMEVDPKGRHTVLEASALHVASIPTHVGKIHKCKPESNLPSINSTQHLKDKDQAA